MPPDVHLGRLLHQLADAINDAHDHDELHAAGAVAHLYGRNGYVTRWIDALLVLHRPDIPSGPGQATESAHE